MNNSCKCKEEKRLNLDVAKKSGGVAITSEPGGRPRSEAGAAVGWVTHLTAGNMEGHRDTTPSYFVLHSQTKEVIYRMNRYFLQEKANREPLLPLTQARKRTAQAAGISEATVKRICSNANKVCDTAPSQHAPVFTSPKKNNPATATNFDDFDKCVLRRTILEFYAKKEIPTLLKIKEVL